MKEAAVTETSHPQQAEALGSTEATEVTTGAETHDLHSKISHDLWRKGNHVHARGDVQGRKEGLQHVLHQTHFLWP